MSTKDITQQHEDNAARVQSAFEAYKKVYSTMHPQPQLKNSDKEWFKKFSLKMFAQIIGIIGAIVVSASHTMPVLVGVDSVMDIEFGGVQFIIALASFAMVEIMAINFAYNATELNAGDKTIQDVAGKIKGGERYLVFILALFNVYYVLISNGVPIHNSIRIGIFLTIGTSAPVVAYLTGKILAVDSLKSRAKSRRNGEEYQDAYEGWLDGLNSSWGRQKKKWGGQVDIQVSKPLSNPVQLDGQNNLLSSGRTSGQDYMYIPNASDKAREYILANPESVTMKVRVLAEIIGVGKSTVSSVRKQLKDNGKI